VVLPSTKLEAAISVGEKLRLAVEQHHFPGVPRPVTISVGAAQLAAGGARRDDIVRPADERLYEAKQAGRNCVWPERSTQAAKAD
jgi:diguanylate cyclase (GGDEF)-like protein